MVTNLDDAVGAIVDKLKETGVWDNTFFLFTSDVSYSNVFIQLELTVLVLIVHRKVDIYQL